MSSISTIAPGSAPAARGPERARRSEAAATEPFAAALAGAMSGQPKPAAPEAKRPEGATELGGAEVDAGGAAAEAEGAAGAAGPGSLASSTAQGAATGDAGVALEAAAAAGAAGPGGVTDPKKVYRGTEGLDPEFQTRFARVAARMKAEHGHEVKVVETIRTQERQEFLFAQGRTRPGPVVTWTLNSNHRAGRAADVIIDGTYNNPKGYARLAEIAAQEGLRTLGAKDPGHVELPRGAGKGPALPVDLGSLASATTPESPGRSAAPAAAQAIGAGGMARVADVARVARVADVARVAEVARVAVPGMAAAYAPAQRGGDRPSGDRSSGGGSETQEAVAELLRMADAGSSELGAAAPAPAVSSSKVQAVNALLGPDVAGRVAHVTELQDGASLRPLSQVVLRLDNAAGGEDRVRIGMRGSLVGATIDVSDPSAAQRMNSRIGELQQALERNGLETEKLQVRRVADAAELAQAVTGVRDAESARAASATRQGDGAQQRERGDRSDPETREGSKEPQQRSKNSKGGNTRDQ